MEKIIGRQTIENPGVNLREAVKQMVEKGVSLKSACETLMISRSSQYRDADRKIKTSSLNEVFVEKLKEVRLAHPF
ncbi:MAG: hypothetical protein H5U06_09010 [Candidatus Aminicenantes bacterium]|nr:hypothetical protein [Candidatus Aminicenantes bacterium]